MFVCAFFINLIHNKRKTKIKVYLDLKFVFHYVYALEWTNAIAYERKKNCSLPQVYLIRLVRF